MINHGNNSDLLFVLEQSLFHLQDWLSKFARQPDFKVLVSKSLPESVLYPIEKGYKHRLVDASHQQFKNITNERTFLKICIPLKPSEI